MDLVINLLFLIAIIYGFSKKMKKEASKKRNTPKYKEQRSSPYLDWEQYESIVLENQTTNKQATSEQEEVSKQIEITSTKNEFSSINYSKNTIQKNEIIDKIHKNEIGTPKISMQRDKIIETIIMAELLGKPKALRK
jgi:hypothetical protein